jgi:hypothetical protein
MDILSLVNLATRINLLKFEFNQIFNWCMKNWISHGMKPQITISK